MEVFFNRRIAMKKPIFTHCLAALTLGAAIAFISCNKLESELPSDDGTITIEFQQVDPDSATRTEFHGKTIRWSAGDKVRFLQYATVNNSKKCVSTYYILPSAQDVLPAISISNFNSPDAGTNSYYFSVFPYASFSSYSTSNGHVIAKINTPDTQTPTATGFDPAADLLISNYAENLTPISQGKYSVQLSYYRQVALGKMRLVNLPSESDIKTVEFSATHGESNVTLAGTTWYDFTTQAPSSVSSRKYKISLDYSGQNISGDMTAFFCCYPFELVPDDSFTVTVHTQDGEVFTRKATIPANKTLAFEADHGTQFTVDMSTATKTDDWLSVDEYSSSSYTKTTNTIFYTFNTTANNVVSGKFMAVSDAVFTGITDIGAYLDANGSDIIQNSIASINENGTSFVTSTNGLTSDSWYVVMCKLVLDDDTVGVNYTRIRTDWFSIAVETRANGGVTYYYYGTNLVSATRNCRFIETGALPDGTSYEEYYNSTLAPGGIPSATLSKINSEGAASYYTTEYYTGKSTKANMVPGTNYTMMVKAVNARGETKFVTANANAGGSAN